MIALLRQNPVLLLFVVAALGFLLGRVRIFGFGLGVAAVLFVGLGVGSLDPGLGLPDFVYLFGLVLFVYTMGLSSGPGFFRSLRRRGLRDNGLVLAVLVADAALVLALSRAFHVSGAHASGIFAGALTNTPALAAVLDTLKAKGPMLSDKLLAEPVVAYSVAYPGGVLGVLATTYLFSRFHKRRPPDETPRSRSSFPVPVSLEVLTVRIADPRVEGRNAGALRRELSLHVAFGRARRSGVDTVVTDDTVLHVGDLVSVVGGSRDLEKAVALLGERSPERIELDRELVDYRRIFVSNPDVTERPLGALELGRRFSAVITRVRRGDVDFLPDDTTDLELGDRVRVVAPREKLEAVAKVLGDSYKALAEIDVIAFSLGIALGLLLGEVPIPLGGITFKLGFAGGPLVVGLVLGRLGRTGRIVWTLPFSANLTLRQIGLVMFLAGVGTRSGYAFGSTLRDGGALTFVALGACATCIACVTLFLGGRALKIPNDVLSGMVAGAHTQPAALAFAVEQTKSEGPNLGYATVFPLATIAKVLLAQLVLALAR